MTVHQIQTEMPASELSDWLAHFKLSKIEHDYEQEKAANKAKRGRL